MKKQLFFPLYLLFAFVGIWNCRQANEILDPQKPCLLKTIRSRTTHFDYVKESITDNTYDANGNLITHEFSKKYISTNEVSEEGETQNISYIYDAKGYLKHRYTEETFWNKYEGKSANTQNSWGETFFYDQSNRLIKLIESNSRQPVPFDDSKGIDYTYDNNGKILKIAPNQTLPTNIGNASYFENGKLKSFSFTENGKEKVIFNCYYNSKGFIEKVENPEFFSKKTFFYDNDNNMVRVELFTRDHGDTSVHDYEYGFNIPPSLLQPFFKGHPQVPTFQKMWEDTRYISSDTYYTIFNGGVVGVKSKINISYRFNTIGYPIEKITDNSNGELSYEIYTYTNCQK